MLIRPSPIQYPDGVHWIKLARLTNPDLIPQTVAKAVGASAQTDRPARERLLDALQEKQLLLALDNCEHLLDACARLGERLLADTKVSVLATSREPLSIAGERLYPVAPLSLPPASLPPDNVDGIMQIVRLYCALGDRDHLSEALTTCGIAAMSLGKYEEEQAMLDEALPLVREAKDHYNIAMLLNFSSDLARCEQKYARAKKAYEECIPLLRDLDAARQLASVLHNLGHACLHLGDVGRARTLFEESMALHRAQQNRVGVAECLIGFAALAIVAGLLAAGARLLAAAVTIGGERVATAWEATRLEYEAALARARADLSENAFHREQAAGRTLSLERAVAYA